MSKTTILNVRALLSLGSMNLKMKGYETSTNLHFGKLLVPVLIREVTFGPHVNERLKSNYETFTFSCLRQIDQLIVTIYSYITCVLY